MVSEVGVAVVPGGELGRRMRAGAVLAGDPEAVVGRRADRVHNRVVALAQLGARHVAAERDPAEDAKRLVRGGLCVHARDRLDLRVVGRDACTYQPEWRRQLVVEIDREPRLQQLVGA